MELQQKAFHGLDNTDFSNGSVICRGSECLATSRAEEYRHHNEWHHSGTQASTAAAGWPGPAQHQSGHPGPCQVWVRHTTQRFPACHGCHWQGTGVEFQSCQGMDFIHVSNMWLASTEFCEAGCLFFFIFCWVWGFNVDDKTSFL